jgi:hypothetical protein
VWSALASGLRVVYISKRIGISISPARSGGSHTETNERLRSDKHDVNIAEEIIAYRFVRSLLLTDPQTTACGEKKQLHVGLFLRLLCKLLQLTS